MAKKTSNYEFNKPEQNDFYDVDVQNENWDKVDEELSEFDDSGVTEDIKSFPDFLSKFVTGNKVAITLRNLKAGLQFVLHAGQIVNNCVTDNTGLPLSAAQGKALKDLIDTTNNNLSKYNFNLGDTTANNHKNIDRIATFSGGTWINKDYNADFGGQWCFVDSFLIDGNGAAIQRIMSAQTNTVLATRYCEKNVWGDWNIGVTKSDLVTRTAIALTAANSYSFNADYTYGYKRAGWVEFQFNLESAFDRSKNNVLHIPDDCVADKQIWFPVFSSSGGNVIARGMVYHTDVHIIGIDAINGAKGLFGHVVYMSKS